MPILKFFSSIAPATEPNERRVFLVSVYYSVVHLGAMIHAFLSTFPAPPYAMIVVHTVLVGLLYAVPKEYERWAEGAQIKPPRPGHVLVALWFWAFVSMSVIQYLTKGAFKLPDGMTEMTTLLLGTLGATKISKLMHAKRNPCSEAGKDLDSKASAGT